MKKALLALLTLLLSFALFACTPEDDPNGKDPTDPPAGPVIPGSGTVDTPYTDIDLSK